MISAAVVCLAMNIYHEARGEPLAGQVAVGHSVLNRVSDRRYPNTVCEVVKQAKYHSWNQKHPIKHKCQYSWFCDGLSDEAGDDKEMLEATILAQYLLNGTQYTIDITEGATHYHANYVMPYWADLMISTVVIGQHIFYR